MIIGAGGDDRGDRLPKDTDTLLTQKTGREGGYLKYPGKLCPCATVTADDIERCLRSRPKPRDGGGGVLTMNCQLDVMKAMNDCCLTGSMVGPGTAPHYIFEWADYSCGAM